MENSHFSQLITKQTEAKCETGEVFQDNFLLVTDFYAQIEDGIEYFTPLL